MSKKDIRIAAYILILLGLISVVVDIMKWIVFRLLWPLILIGIGIYLLSRNSEKSVKKEDDK